MSSKASKRRQRRINTHEEEPEKKVEEITEQNDDSKSNISTDTDKVEKDTSLKEENGESEQNIKESNGITVQNGKDTNTATENTETECIEPSNGQLDNQIINSQSADLSEGQKSLGNDENSDIEPLIFDSEDTELQYPAETASDIEKSPMLTRCQTRRSQTRNIPTPKTPKTLDFNGDAECKSEVRVNITRLPAPEVIVTPPPTDSAEEKVETQDISFESATNNETQEKLDESAEVCEDSEEDLANASVFVNYTGNDTTRNLDITSTLDENPTGPSFLETTKDLSYGETLRCISGRKAVRHFNENSSYKPRFYKSTIDLTSKDLTDAAQKFKPLTPAPASGTKRKLNRDSPEEYKRAKTDGDTSGLMSFIQSPFKTKTSRTEIPSSTPKLTAFKYTPHQGSTMIDEVSKIDLELHPDRPTNMAESKKWCSIM